MAARKKTEVNQTSTSTEDFSDKTKVTAPKGLSKQQKESLGAGLATLLAPVLEGKSDDVFQDFIGLTQDLKKKQDELDIMAADSLPAAILTDYVSDVLLPNSAGDLVTIIAKDVNSQSVYQSIYDRLSLPLEKIVYSLLKNGIAIGEFEQVTQHSLARQVAGDTQVKSATEAVSSKAAGEAVYIRDPGTILPNISIIPDTYTVFPLLQYEKCIGFLEVKADRTIFNSFDWEKDVLNYKDIVIHPLIDYAYETFGVPHSSKPLQLKVEAEDGTISTYTVATGCSLLEDAYTAWKTLSLLEDSIVLASLIKNTQIMLVECQAGTATAEQVEAARIKLRSLFEGQLSMGRQGLRSYLNPQSKPAFVYSFVSGEVGKISTSLVGGEYNPGQLYYIQPFVNKFFAAFRAPKQNYGYTEGAGGLDGGGAVEQYTKRYNSTVLRVKRILGSFIRKCINNVLMSKGFTKLVNQFEVKINGVFDEAASQEIQAAQTKLSFYESILTFTGEEDPAKLKALRAILLKDIITDSQIIGELTKILAPDTEQEPPEDAPADMTGNSQLTDDVASQLGLGDEGGEEPAELPPPVGDTGGAPEETELPEMGDTLSQDTGEQ